MFVAIKIPGIDRILLGVRIEKPKDFRGNLILNYDIAQGYRKLNFFDDEYFGKGNRAFSEKRYDDAIALFKKAISERKTKDVTLGKYHNRLGDAYNLSRDYPKGYKHYDLAITLNPKDGNAVLGKSGMLVELGNYKDASKMVDKAIQLKEPKAQSYKQFMISKNFYINY